MENKVNRDNGNKCTSTPKPFEYTLVKSSEGSGIGLSWKDKKKNALSGIWKYSIMFLYKLQVIQIMQPINRNKNRKTILKL